MNTIDVRTKEPEVKEIRFADVVQGDSYKTGTKLSINELGVHMCTKSDDDRSAAVRLKDIPNFILALEKAVELGWHLK